MRFDGATYESEHDQVRLTGQLSRVYQEMAIYAELDVWVTLNEISMLTCDPEASISARLRDLRKPRFGGHDVQRRRRGDPKDGIWEYRLASKEPEQGALFV